VPRRRKAPTLAPAASQDIRELLQWSEEKFGQSVAVRYRALLKQALRDVQADPERPGSKERPELTTGGIRTYPISFSRSRVGGPGVKNPRHVLVYRYDSDVIEIVRVLHDARDLERHVHD